MVRLRSTPCRLWGIEHSAMLTILDEPSLARVAAPLAAIQRNSIRLTATRADEAELPVGASKLGGQPDLPPGWAWPTTTLPRPSSVAPGVAKSWSGAVLPPDDVIALPFIAQICLADVHPYDTEALLPPSGILYFFYNPVYYVGVPYAKPGGWQVLYYNGDLSQLERIAPPRAIPPQATYQTCALTFSAEPTLPQVETCYIGETEDSPAKIVLTPDEWEVYAELRYDLRANQSIHQMLGYADDTQPYAMENPYREARPTFWPDLPAWEQLTPAEQQREWEQGRLLLQLSEQDNGMRFGRDGRLFFFIREQDLRSRNFAHVWATEQ
jgi:uncharacterized protein YwqG